MDKRKNKPTKKNSIELNLFGLYEHSIHISVFSQDIGYQIEILANFVVFTQFQIADIKTK